MHHLITLLLSPQRNLPTFPADSLPLLNDLQQAPEGPFPHCCLQKSLTCGCKMWNPINPALEVNCILISRPVLSVMFEFPGVTTRVLTVSPAFCRQSAAHAGLINRCQCVGDFGFWLHRNALRVSCSNQTLWLQCYLGLPSLQLSSGAAALYPKLSSLAEPPSSCFAGLFHGTTNSTQHAAKSICRYIKCFHVDSGNPLSWQNNNCIIVLNAMLNLLCVILFYVE